MRGSSRTRGRGGLVTPPMPLTSNDFDQLFVLNVAERLEVRLPGKNVMSKAS